MTTKIFNLIILDESGSMSCMERQTIDGCNETINTIISAQKKYADSQEHYVSIYAFQSGHEKPSRYLIKNEAVKMVKHITSKDYSPWGGTPLFDAVGETLTDLKHKVDKEQSAIGSVTIITDGAENSSERYSGFQVSEMIKALKEKGWNFNFIGANIDVKKAAMSLNIDNYLAFEQSEAEVSTMFERERNARMSYYGRVNCTGMGFARPEEREAHLREASRGYFEKSEKDARVAPDRIKGLKENEIFVFGSNLQGYHQSGAAHAAVKYYGAVMGQGVGLQGKSYAIPTMQGGVEAIRPYVDQFIEFAINHPELKFLVTRIGCGIAGFRDEDIAPLFIKAKDVENIFLPQSFWHIIG